MGYNCTGFYWNDEQKIWVFYWKDAHHSGGKILATLGGQQPGDWQVFTEWIRYCVAEASRLIEKLAKEQVKYRT